MTLGCPECGSMQTDGHLIGCGWRARNWATDGESREQYLRRRLSQIWDEHRWAYERETAAMQKELCDIIARKPMLPINWEDPYVQKAINEVFGRCQAAIAKSKGCDHT
jgi:hypothetical protein